MVKNKTKFIETLIYLYLIIFPFGNILTFRINLFDRQIPLNFSDFVSFIFLVFFLFNRMKFPLVFVYLKNFLILVIFSQVLFISLNGIKNSSLGFLYLLRLFSYSAMFVVLWNFFEKSKDLKKKIVDYLIVVFFFIAIFGWLQYFLFPDMRAFSFWGWDDHLFRMVGTFFDPTFTAILLVFGVIICLAKYQKTKKVIYVVGLLPIILALYFTYSRAGYLALIFGILVYLIIKKKLKISLFIIPLFVFGLFFLPHSGGEGTNLRRMFSIEARIENYKQTTKIFLENPVFGVGYNNICWAKQNYLGIFDTNSHACSGSDSGILFLLATTGLVGFIIFSMFCYMLIRTTRFDFYGMIFISCLSSLFVHSQLSNSIFYPWVMGIIVFLASLAVKE